MFWYVFCLRPRQQYILYKSFSTSREKGGIPIVKRKNLFSFIGKINGTFD